MHSTVAFLLILVQLIALSTAQWGFGYPGMGYGMGMGGPLGGLEGAVIGGLDGALMGAVDGAMFG
ncbi:hypothetical protein V3C99_014861 [Haemonchus contortus]|uniref:Uncharacterized protein n=1 Tax=Haemonchus contortus TaxID=6289 RepID=A0A7I4YUH3_HAECO